MKGVDNAMKIQTLKDRIQNAESKIEKKQATIQKKTEWIAKKEAKLINLSEQERKWAEWDIQNWKDDIQRLNYEIAELQTSIESYEKQLSDEIAKEEVLLKEIPESMKRMQAELVEKWDAWDIERRNFLKEEYKLLGWSEFHKNHKTKADYLFKDLTDDQLHNRNLKDAKCLILDLCNRVKHITGEITDWTGIRAEQGTCGVAVLNGVVLGKEGRCKVESILAGGYNIQRLHVRVLTYEI